MATKKQKPNRAAANAPEMPDTISENGAGDPMPDELRKRIAEKLTEAEIPEEMHGVLIETLGAVAETLEDLVKKRLAAYEKLLKPLTDAEMGYMLILHNDFTVGSKQWAVMGAAAKRLNPDGDTDEFREFAKRFDGTILEGD